MTLGDREPAGFAKVAAPVMAGAIRANRKHLQRLKRILGQ